MAKYTLFVDESGDFESNRGEWVLSGALCKAPFAAAEKQIGNVAAAIPAKYGLAERKDLHMHDLRRKWGHERALNVARSVLEAIGRLEIHVQLVGVVNRSKRRIGQRESTYRLMLLDLMALAESLLDQDVAVEQFDLVIATRTIHGHLATTVSEITEDVLERVEEAFEVGLASKGLIESLEAKAVHIHHQCAKNSWGLTLADIAANLLYNSRHRNSRSLIRWADERFGFHIFDSFGGYEVRRARIAERDGRLSTAFIRWASYNPQGSADKTERRESLDRLGSRLLSSKEDVGSKQAVLESIIEGLRRQHVVSDDFRALYVALRAVELALQQHCKSLQDRALLFRLRSFMLTILNRGANIADSDRILTELDEQHDDLATDPEYFPLVLRFYPCKINYFVNLLSFEEAYETARQFANVIDRYGEVWDLLTDGGGVQGFHRSRLRLMAQSTLARCEILFGRYNRSVLPCAAKRLTELEHFETSDRDLRRSENYRFWHAIHSDSLAEPIRQLDTLLTPEATPFDIYFAARTAAEAHFKYGDNVVGSAGRVLAIIKELDFGNQSGHPYDLIWRERGVLLHRLGGSRKEVLHAFRQSNRALQTLDPEAPIHQLLSYVLTCHKEYVLSGEIRSTPPSTLHSLLSKARPGKSPTELDLRAIRALSPF